MPTSNLPNPPESEYTFPCPACSRLVRAMRGQEHQRGPCPHCASMIACGAPPTATATAPAQPEAIQWPVSRGTSPSVLSLERPAVEDWLEQQRARRAAGSRPEHRQSAVRWLALTSVAAGIAGLIQLGFVLTRSTPPAAGAAKEARPEKLATGQPQRQADIDAQREMALPARHESSSAVRPVASGTASPAPGR